MVTGTALSLAVSDLELDNRAIMIHSSLRSFGEPVDNGPDGVLDAFLGHGCTVLVPTFSESHFQVIPPPQLRPPRNGVNYTEMSAASEWLSGPVFTTSCGLIDADMGSLPAAVVRREDALRGLHPLDSFAALGPLADRLIRDQSPVDVYAPIRTLAEADGAVLLMGVGLNRMTALHLAEQSAGRPLFIRWARRSDGSTAMVETGGCSEGFHRLEPYLAGLAATLRVGRSEWRLFPMSELLDAAASVIRQDRTASSCCRPDCRLCRDAELGGPTAGGRLG
jgi:aminoglycoside 3-N-acetyltransferase